MASFAFTYDVNGGEYENTVVIDGPKVRKVEQADDRTVLVNGEIRVTVGEQIVSPPTKFTRVKG